MIRHDGDNHLGLRCGALLEHQVALITSDCAPSRLSTASSRPRRRSATSSSCWSCSGWCSASSASTSSRASSTTAPTAVSTARLYCLSLTLHCLLTAFPRPSHCHSSALHCFLTAFPRPSHCLSSALHCLLTVFSLQGGLHWDWDRLGGRRAAHEGVAQAWQRELGLRQHRGGAGDAVRGLHARDVAGHHVLHCLSTAFSLPILDVSLPVHCLSTASPSSFTAFP